MERIFVMIKPDGVAKGLVEEIISRFEKKGLKIDAKEDKHLSEEEATKLYSIHKGKEFFESLIEYVTSGPVVLLVISDNKSIIKKVRDLMGATDPKEADPGTIRGDFATEISENIVHGSDSIESANREISIFFPRFS